MRGSSERIFGLFVGWIRGTVRAGAVGWNETRDGYEVRNGEGMKLQKLYTCRLCCVEPSYAYSYGFVHHNSSSIKNNSPPAHRSRFPTPSYLRACASADLLENELALWPGAELVARFGNKVEGMCVCAPGIVVGRQARLQPGLGARDEARARVGCMQQGIWVGAATFWIWVHVSVVAGLLGRCREFVNVWVWFDRTCCKMRLIKSSNKTSFFKVSFQYVLRSVYTPSLHTSYSAQPMSTASHLACPNPSHPPKYTAPSPPHMYIGPRAPYVNATSFAQPWKLPVYIPRFCH